MKNVTENAAIDIQNRLFGQRVTLNDDATCTEVIDILFETKERFHMLRQHVFHHQELLLNASILSNKQQWQAHIALCERELKTLEDDIAASEVKLRELLWSANLMLDVTLDEEEKNTSDSSSTVVTMVNDLKALKQEIGDLQIHRDALFFCCNSTMKYPTYTQNAGIQWRKKNDGHLYMIQQSIDEEKQIDREKNRKIQTQYKKIVDATQKVMSHDVYSYKQSLRTIVLNMVRILTGAWMLGFYNRASSFLLWDTSRRGDLHKKESDECRGTADILGIPKTHKR